MNLIVYHDDLSVTQHALEKEHFYNPSIQNKVGYIGSDKKENNALQFFESFYNEGKAILFDHTNKIILQKLQTLGIEPFDSINPVPTIFDEKDFSMMYFTSGSTGESVGALKTKQHLLEEIKVLTKLFSRKKIKRVVVTVPFIHIYGTLFGLLYPFLNGLDIILKEHFLPHDLLHLIDEHSLVVTTPLYIKALNKIGEHKDLSSSTFVSSTGPLDAQSAVTFAHKFNTDVIQIFGSTETGGIAYKTNDETLWTPLQSVQVSTNEQSELQIASPFVSDELYENGFKSINGVVQSFDYVELNAHNQFKLIGRSSQILKIAGKRYSTIQIEHILEAQEDIAKALVFVEHVDDALKDEILDITLETKTLYTTKQIKQILQHNLSNLKFSIKLTLVEHIPTSSVGKKLKIT